MSNNKTLLNRTANYELEITPGIEAIAEAEVIEKHMQRLTHRPQRVKGALRVTHKGNPEALLKLETVHAIYSLERYDIPRPKAFMGHQHMTRLLDQIQLAIALNPPKTFQTIHINAAGSDSSVMQRLLHELGEAAGLQPNTDDGDLVLRLRRSKQKDGWEALVRLTPRPISVRGWRVENVPGALNGAVAQAMIRLSDPASDQVVMNAACGSGSLAIERGRWGKASEIYACDIDLDMIEKAMANVESAGLSDRIEIRAWDATDIPMATNSVDVTFADLPFGNHVGDHTSNEQLYPRVLAEVARITKRDGRFVLITHEIKLMDTMLDGQNKWEVEQVIKITLSGLHPRIYVLRRM